MFFICSNWRCNWIVGKICYQPDPNKGSIPVLTLITNLIGAILIGFIVGYLGGREATSKNMLLFWKIEIQYCSTYTTV